MTRGHYRSCGKDPHACCVSDLLGDQPLIRSGFQQTYSSDKDTGRYWEAGARNVHWVVVTDGQVERGIKLALERVKGAGVLIEGNSFLRFIDVDFAILVTRAVPRATAAKIKGSTRWAFEKASAFYLFDQTETVDYTSIDQLKARFRQLVLSKERPVYTSADMGKLLTAVNNVHLLRTCRKRYQYEQG